MGISPAFNPQLKRTPLYHLHVALGAKMVPFAGYEMPVQYPLGILKEHLWTRDKAGLFDVSHMGQAVIVAGDASHESAARALEALVPADILNLNCHQQRYTQFLIDDGGILDDLMVTRGAPEHAGSLSLVVNAARKETDFAYLTARLPPHVKLHRRDGLALVALQGPKAVDVLARHAPGVAGMGFMTAIDLKIDGIRLYVSRSGYTGEDGFEISVDAEAVTKLWEMLCGDRDVQPVGLGARDSLRLEAGLCLYDHDIDATTSPVEAGLAWSIQKRRRLEGGYVGATRIQSELQQGPKRRRVGLKPEGRAPAREGTTVLDMSGHRIGIVTSGGFGPSVNGPVAMGYIASEHVNSGTRVQLVVRGKPLPALIADLPFVPHRYFRKLL
jgi:aminomethyltransferase